MEQLKLNITEQDVKVNHASVYRKHDDIMLVLMDLGTKRADWSCLSNDENGCPEITLCSEVGIDGETVVSFPTLSGWGVFSISITKYTAFICLEKI